MIINSKLLPKPVVLYSGSTTSTATLSQTIANFKRIKVFGVNTDNYGVYTEFYNNNSSTAKVILFSSAVGGYDAYQYSGSVDFNGASVSLNRLSLTRIRNNNNSVVSANADAIKITRIEGYTD